METLCFKCHHPITGRQGHIQYISDWTNESINTDGKTFPGESTIRDFHAMCESSPRPLGWSRWDRRTYPVVLEANEPHHGQNGPDGKCKICGR